MNELLARYPEAADVLAKHGVNPLTRCNHAVRAYLKLGQILGRTCPVDDADTTLADLEALIRREKS